jgi:hypothetical protein
VITNRKFTEDQKAVAPDLSTHLRRSMNTWRSISSKKIKSLIKWKVCVAQRSFPLDCDQLTEDASGLGAGGCGPRESGN